jgi:hypothetical protein
MYPSFPTFFVIFSNLCFYAEDGSSVLFRNTGTHLPYYTSPPAMRQYYHVYDSLYTGLGLVITFIGFLQIVTISNYKAIGNLHLTRAHNMSSKSAVSSPVVAW